MNYSTEFCYYAKLPHGVILEDSCLKTLYYAVLHEMKSEYGHSIFYDFGAVDICAGVRVEWWNGHCVECKHLEFKKYLHIFVSSMDKVTLTCIEKMEE